MIKMKLIGALISIVVFSLTSCTKEYTCTCTYEDASTGGTITEIYEYGEVDLDVAEKSCQDSEEIWKFSDPNASCTL